MARQKKSEQGKQRQDRDASKDSDRSRTGAARRSEKCGDDVTNATMIAVLAATIV